jgi:hypothetical protein
MEPFNFNPSSRADALRAVIEVLAERITSSDDRNSSLIEAAEMLAGDVCNQLNAISSSMDWSEIEALAVKKDAQLSKRYKVHQEKIARAKVRRSSPAARKKALDRAARVIADYRDKLAMEQHQSDAKH